MKKQGIHFNAKLASSSALKNPSLLPKLMRSAGVENSKQYASTLPLEFWNPLNLPEWAYKEELGKSQQTLAKKKEEERAKNQRESVEFVASGYSARSSSGNPSGINAKGMKGSAAERVMAGLDRDRTM